jgi:hypothetical protein
VPKSTVSDIKKRNIPDSKPKSGRPKIWSDRDKCRIEAYIRKSKETRQESPDHIIRTLHLSCSVPILVKAIHELGYHRRIARRCCLLKKIDYRRRLAFARAYKHWMVEDWKRVI